MTMVLLYNNYFSHKKNRKFWLAALKECRFKLNSSYPEACASK
jgi:hypothetical protein